MKEKKLKLEYEKKKIEIENRLKEFKKLNKDEIFYELCFCLLTPQTSARRADMAIQELIKHDFKNKEFNPVNFLKSNVRFHNNKSKNLILAKENFENIYNEIKNSENDLELREFLVKNVKGMGYKEAGHFLRNIGKENLAILDRHILKNLVKLKAIGEIPKTLTRNNYLYLEEKFKEYSGKIGIPMDHLDLLFWSFEAEEIFK